MLKRPTDACLTGVRRAAVVAQLHERGVASVRRAGDHPTRRSTCQAGPAADAGGESQYVEGTPFVVPATEVVAAVPGIGSMPTGVVVSIGVP